MATDALNDAVFWLPTEFLTDDDILIDKENLLKNQTKGDEEDLLTELTRKLTRSTLLDTHKFTSSTQNLESWGLSGLPQSTLNGLGRLSTNGTPNGPSQVPSPPTTSFGLNDAVLDLIYQAAGQVARLKMNCNGPTNDRDFLNEQRTLTGVHPLQLMKTPISGLRNNQCVSHAHLHNNHVRHNQVVKQQGCGIWGKQEGWYSQNNGSRVGNGGGGGGYVDSGRWGGRPQPLGFGQSSAWPALQVQKNQTQQLHKSGSGMKAVFLGGSVGGGVKKRGCAGTGVFLPRCYGNLTENRKKPGCSTALLPAKVVHALNKNFDDTSIRTLPQAQPRFNGAFISDYDMLMARRAAAAALVTEQRGGGSIRAEGPMMNHEMRLPQAWTYY